ncbi:MAG: hypothetical protein MJZ20_03135 [Bacteroidaceae bacterium]|nr:hypothetical protein [Bacteroidaceae bacterium]
MEYKYGELSSNQIKKQKKYFQGAIYQLIPYREEGYAFLDGRFLSILQQLDGFNRLFDEQAVILTIMSLLEYARAEADFNKYRKAILDAVALVNEIKEVSSNV